MKRTTSLIGAVIRTSRLWELLARNFVRHLKQDMLMTPTAGNLSLFVRRIQGKLKALTSAYVDDSIGNGNDAFQTASEITARVFDSRPRDTN